MNRQRVNSTEQAIMSFTGHSPVATVTSLKRHSVCFPHGTLFAGIASVTESGLVSSLVAWSLVADDGDVPSVLTPPPLLACPVATAATCQHSRCVCYFFLASRNSQNCLPSLLTNHTWSLPPMHHYGYLTSRSNLQPPSSFFPRRAASCFLSNFY